MGAEPWNWSAFGRGEFPGTSFGTSSNYSETSGVKSGSARSPKGGGKGASKRQLGCRLARHPPRLVARVNRSISMLFYRNSTASFSNPPLVPFDPKSWLIFRAALSNGSRSKIGTRERERRDDSTGCSYTLRPTFSSSIHGYRSFSRPLLLDESVERCPCIYLSRV